MPLPKDLIIWGGKRGGCQTPSKMDSAGIYGKGDSELLSLLAIKV